MAIAINFVMDQGTLFEAYATIENEDGSLFDLTGLTPYCQMRKSYYTSSGHDINAEVDGDPLNGVVKLTLLPADSNLVKAGRYVYDVEVHNGDGTYVKRVLQGIITVNPQVTRIP
jgi:hypothetical protein